MASSRRCTGDEREGPGSIQNLRNLRGSLYIQISALKSKYSLVMRRMSEHTLLVHTIVTIYGKMLQFTASIGRVTTLDVERDYFSLPLSDGSSWCRLCRGQRLLAPPFASSFRYR